MRRRIVGGLTERRRAPAAALVVDDDAPVTGVEKPSMHRRGARTGPAMEEERRDPARVAGFLPVHRVTRIERQTSRAIGFDRWEEIAAAGHLRSVSGRPLRLKLCFGREAASDEGVVPLAPLSR